VDLGTGQATGAEAVVSWDHPDLAGLPADQIRSAIRHGGLLTAFTTRVLRQALAAAAGWAAAGHPLTVEVAIAPRSLLDPAFADLVDAELAASAVPPGALTLQVTDTLPDSQRVIADRTLARLRDAGVRIALDDFGTGYWSPSRLLDLPVHQIKIDEGLVGALIGSRDASAIVHAVADLARRLDLTVTARGIARPEQRHHLWTIGCTGGQGSLFGGDCPFSAEALLRLIQRGHRDTPGALAPVLHQGGSVIAMPPPANRRPG
jgi:EAL domain-containing protein (putative c-di-GMP-specific phosphodiesterase class I)